MRPSNLPGDLDCYLLSIKRRLNSKPTPRSIPPVFDELRKLDFISRNQFSPVKYTLTDKQTKSKPCRNTLVPPPPDSSFEKFKRMSIMRQKRHSSMGVLQGRKTMVRVDMFRREDEHNRVRRSQREGGRKSPKMNSHRQRLCPIETEVKLQLSSEKIQPRDKMGSIMSVRNHRKQLQTVQSPKPTIKKPSTFDPHPQPQPYQTLQPPPPPFQPKMPFKFLKKGQNMRHFMAACFLKSKADEKVDKQKDTTAKDRNQLHRLLGLFVGPVNGIKVGKDIETPNPIADYSVETERRSASAWSRKRRTEGGVLAEEQKKIAGWENPE